MKNPASDWARLKRVRSFSVLALFAAANAVSAFPGYLTTWSSTYPSSTSSSGVSCALCHTSTGGGNGWNFYGWGIRQERFNNGLTIGAAILAVANVDSDGNGDSNLTEINANTQPGWTVGSVNTSFLKNGSTISNLAPPAQGTPDPLDAFATWITSFNLTGNDALRSADPDGDGSSNDDEYRFGGVPSDPGSRPVVQVDPNNGSNPSFTADIRVDDSALIYIPTWSRNLGEFNDTNFTTTSDVASPLGNSYVRRTFNTDLTGEPRLFFQMVSVDQTITFAPLPIKTSVDADFTLSATASSGLPVTYVSLDPSVATVSGNVVTIVGPGTVVIRASQPGDGTIGAAVDVDQVLTINPYDQRVTLELEPVVTDALISPVDITNAADGSDRLFIAEQRGTIRIIDSSGSLLGTPFLDIESKLVIENPFYDERGLLGLAFHPDFGTASADGEGKFYVYYSAPSPNAPGTASNPVDHTTVLAEYCVSGADPNVADPASERILLTLDQPQFNHNGGGLGFGPDGYLYVSIGDGGGQNDNEAGHTGGDSTQPAGALGNAQDLTNLFGSLLRIDVLGTNGPGGEYGIPSDNPFFDSAPARGEIYAYGLRNSWRFSFDDGPGGTNRLFGADVGQDDVEEVNLITSGGNYGWRRKEGSFVVDPVLDTGSATLIDPIAEYAHPDTLVGLPRIGRSITGGFVYRGDAIPALDGFYIFGDWSSDFVSPSGTIMALEETSPDEFELFILDIVGGNPVGKFLPTFGEDEAGEIYVATKTTLAVGTDSAPTGSIYKIIPSAP